jgi:hypothetical protein
MAIDIKQEILDWYNTNDEGETADYFDEAWEDFNESLVTKKNADERGWTTPALASGPAYKVAEYGGEGQGDDLWVVFQVGDQFFKVEGYYSSWDGGRYDDPTPYEVEPVQVTVTEYRAKK